MSSALRCFLCWSIRGCESLAVQITSACSVYCCVHRANNGSHSHRAWYQHHYVLCTAALLCFTKHEDGSRQLKYQALGKVDRRTRDNPAAVGLPIAIHIHCQPMQWPLLVCYCYFVWVLLFRLSVSILVTLSGICRSGADRCTAWLGNLHGEPSPVLIEKILRFSQFLFNSTSSFLSVQ